VVIKEAAANSQLEVPLRPDRMLQQFLRDQSPLLLIKSRVVAGMTMWRRLNNKHLVNLAGVLSQPLKQKKLKNHLLKSSQMMELGQALTNQKRQHGQELKIPKRDYGQAQRSPKRQHGLELKSLQKDYGQAQRSPNRQHGQELRIQRCKPGLEPDKPKLTLKGIRK
jgi:hypothetical protein